MTVQGSPDERPPPAQRLCLTPSEHVFMTRLPEDFRQEFDGKGETFFGIAEVLYTHPDRQFTLDELAEKLDRSNTTISNHTGEMVDENWLTRRENQTTISWNTNAHNPANTEGAAAAKLFYRDLVDLVSKHSSTVPGAFAIIGFVMNLAALVLATYFVIFALTASEEPVIQPVVFLAIAIAFLGTGMVLTFLSPIQACMNRFVSRLVLQTVR